MGNRLQYRHIQESVEAINRFVEKGAHPGDFLYAVLTNNLKESFARADCNNRTLLFDIVRYCYNEIPGAAWGSVEKVEEWMKAVKAAHEYEKGIKS